MFVLFYVQLCRSLFNISCSMFNCVVLLVVFLLPSKNAIYNIDSYIKLCSYRLGNMFRLPRSHHQAKTEHSLGT